MLSAWRIKKIHTCRAFAIVLGDGSESRHVSFGIAIRCNFQRAMVSRARRAKVAPACSCCRLQTVAASTCNSPNRIRITIACTILAGYYLHTLLHGKVIDKSSIIIKFVRPECRIQVRSNQQRSRHRHRSMALPTETFSLLEDWILWISASRWHSRRLQEYWLGCTHTWMERVSYLTSQCLWDDESE